MTDKLATNDIAIAKAIDDFSYDYDPFEYLNNHDERGGALDEIIEFLHDDPEGLADILDEMADDAADYGERSTALRLAERVRTYHRQAELDALYESLMGRLDARIESMRRGQ